MPHVKKKVNPFVLYFKPFGLRQICDFLMLASLVVLIVGLCTNNTVLLAGFAVMTAASLCAITRSCLTLFSKKVHHRSPEYRSAIINVIIMSVIFALSLFGLIWAIVI